MISVKVVNDQLIDVFVGKGWTNWSRFYVVYDKGRLHLKLVKGSPMTREDFNELYQLVSK